MEFISCNHVHLVQLFENELLFQKYVPNIILILCNHAILNRTLKRTLV